MYITFYNHCHIIPGDLLIRYHIWKAITSLIMYQLVWILDMLLNVTLSLSLTLYTNLGAYLKIFISITLIFYIQFFKSFKNLGTKNLDPGLFVLVV